MSTSEVLGLGTWTGSLCWNRFGGRRWLGWWHCGMFIVEYEKKHAVVYEFDKKMSSLACSSQTHGVVNYFM